MKKLFTIFFAALIFIFSFSYQAFAEMIITVTSAKVNVRSGPDTSYDKLGLVTEGEVFTVINEENGWYQIVYPTENAESAWIIDDYVALSQNDTLPASVSAQTTNVNIRSGPGTEYTWLGQLEYGTKYAVVGEQGYWYEIRYTQEQNVFVAKWLCLTWDDVITFHEDPSEPDPGDNPPVPVENPYDKAGYLKHGTVNTDDLNLRVGSSTSTDIITSLSVGSKVAIYERDNDDWFYVVAENGQTGYVYADYIDIDNTASSVAAGGMISLPSWDENGSTVGVMNLSVTESSYGVQFTITADTDIVYKIEQTENGYDFVSDMSFYGASGTLNGISWLLGGNTYNRMSISSENGIFYRIEGSNNQKQIDIFVSAYPVLGKIIYLDPGHSVWNNGVLDPGAIGPNGTRENIVVLAIAQKLKTILESYGATVYLTHEGESTLTRPERCSLANNAGADIFVSIHANSSTSSTPNGTTVYTYAPEGNGNYDRNLRMLLSQTILQSILEYTGLYNYGVRETGFDVLVYTKMPAVLIETAFISNPEEEMKLADPTFQQLMAQAIAEGICDYFYQLDNK